MILSITYYLGNDSHSKDFNNYTDAISFIEKLREVENSDFLHFDFYIYSGKEEIRIRKLISKEEE